MKAYRNLSRTTKTFYGVEFHPGEICIVPGAINDARFVEVAVPKHPGSTEVSEEVAHTEHIESVSVSNKPNRGRPKKVDSTKIAVKKAESVKSHKTEDVLNPELKDNSNTENSIEEVISNGEHHDK